MESSKKTMWGYKGKTMEIDQYFIYHQIPTTAGQSGAPIYKLKGNRPYVCGIHTRGIYAIERNMGIRLTKEVRQRMNKWIGSSGISLNLSN